MSSLHDKYFSEINRNYIYKLCCQIINDKYNVDISEDKYFKEIFTKNMNEAFQKTDTDELSVVNRNLLNIQIENYKHLKKDTNSCMILNAVNRNIEENDSIYNFIISTYEGKYHIKYIVLSKEKNVLFSNPFIIVNINDIDIYLKLNSTYELQNRIFLEYIPIHSKNLNLTKITKINIKSSLNILPKKNGYLSISKINEDYIEVENNYYKEGDIIKINDNIFNIKNIRNNKDIFLDNIKDYDLTEGENILNISESPIIIFDKITN